MKTSTLIWRLLLGIVIVLSAITIGAWVFRDKIQEYNINLYTSLINELYSLLILGGIALYFAGKAKKQQTDAKRKEKLQHLLSRCESADPKTALRAIEELRTFGFLTDGSLRNHSFRNVRVKNAPFAEADLEGCAFFSSELELADFRDIKGEGIQFSNCRMKYADFSYAEIPDSVFESSWIEESSFHGARGVNSIIFPNTYLDKCCFRKTNSEYEPREDDDDPFICIHCEQEGMGG